MYHLCSKNDEGYSIGHFNLPNRSATSKSDLLIDISFCRLRLGLVRDTVVEANVLVHSRNAGMLNCVHGSRLHC